MRLLKIGREPGNDIVLHSDKVSSLHAEITLLDSGDIQLEDKNSRNGTYIMNQRIAPGKPVNVRRGDAIRFADVELQWSQIPMPEDNSAYKAIFGIGSNFQNDLQISGATVSRYHATIKLGRDGKVYIVDHSKNGTTVNGSRISPNQPYRIKKSSTVVCGGVPVDTSRIPWPVNPWKWIVGIAAALVIVAGVGFGVWRLTRPTLDPSDLTAATVYVHGSYYITAEIEGDQLPDLFKKYGLKWPSVYHIVPAKMDGGRIVEWAVSMSDDDVTPIGYSGTAFFIDREGRMGTNRHIAVPWEYLDNLNGDGTSIAIQGAMEVFRNRMMPVAQITNMDELRNLAESSQLGELLFTLLVRGYCTLNEIRGYVNNFRSNRIKIKGHHAFIAIGYPNRNYNSTDEFERCTIVKESGDDNIDVAIMQLNSHKTPEDIKYIYDIRDARTDVSTLKPQKENLFTIGYPAGLILGLNNMDGGLKATIHKINLSKEPGHYNFQFQGEELGGASGSPIIDGKGKLVGVLWGGFAAGSTFGEACEVKYLKRLYEDSNSEGNNTRVDQPYSSR
ncbi:MAG: FHA domain-containing protein [Bacteroidaceae bacterium]|nr:FHA domain-containing protein [Bacteroidaceae bacterium]